MSMRRYILEFSVLTFIGLLIVIALCVWLVRLVHRRHDKTDSEVKSVGDQVATLAENTHLDHRATDRKIDTNSGRLQFLTARTIAEELEQEKKRQQPGSKGSEES
jgi:hypothetical protein